MFRPDRCLTNRKASPARRQLRFGDLVVCRLGYGAMRITGDGAWGPPRDRENAKGVLRSAVDLGVNLIDMADSYGPSVADELIAEALYPYAPDLVIATKAGYARSGPGAWTPNGRPDHLRASCDESLKRLRVEAIALFQLHCVDPKVPFEESLGALADLRNAGKIRNIGDLMSIWRNSAGPASSSASFRCRTAQSRRPGIGTDIRSMRKVPCGLRSLCALGRRQASPGPGRREVGQGSSRAHAGAGIDCLAAEEVSLHVPIPGTASLSHLRENIAAAGLPDAKSQPWPTPKDPHAGGDVQCSPARLFRLHCRRVARP